MVKKEYEFQETSRDHSNSIDNSKNREHDSCNHKTEDQRKDDVISDAKFLDVLEGVLHKEEADSLQKQNYANQKAYIDTAHREINHPLPPPVLSYRRSHRRKQSVLPRRLRVQEVR